MVWWIVAGLVVVFVLGLVAVSAALRRRLAEPDRVSTLAGEHTAEVQRRLAAAVQGDRAGTLRRAGTCHVAATLARRVSIRGRLWLLPLPPEHRVGSLHGADPCTR